jgi:predicted metal-binding protein
MKPVQRTLPINYSVRAIIDCILSDNFRAKKYSCRKKTYIYNELLIKTSKVPELKSVLTPSHIKSYRIEGAELFARIGILPPELVIVDERFKNMCCMPYWTVYKGSDGGAYKHFGRCPGYGWLPGCPPQSPPVESVQAVLDRADIFIVLETKLLSERWKVGWKFAVLHRLARDIEAVLGKGTVIERYGSGPCNACTAQPCLHSQPCAAPKLKTISLESMGICVDRLCSDLALLTGDPRWRLTWLKHFGLPQQKPEKWKYVEALAVKLPEQAAQ